MFNSKFKCFALGCFKNFSMLSVGLLFAFALIGLFSCESRSAEISIIIEGEASNPIVDSKLSLQLGSPAYHLNASIVPSGNNDRPVYSILNVADSEKAISLDTDNGIVKAIGFAKQASVRVSSSKNSKIYKDILVTVADNSIVVVPENIENPEVVVAQGSSIDLNPSSGDITNIQFDPNNIFEVQLPDEENPIGRIMLADDVAEEDIGKLVTVTVTLVGDNSGVAEYDFIVGRVIPVESISLSPSSFLLAKDDVGHAGVTVTPQNSTYIESKYLEFISSDADVATAVIDDSDDNLIKITATTDDVTKTCTVTARSKKHSNISGSASISIKPSQLPSGEGNVVELPLPQGSTITSFEINPVDKGTINGNTFVFNSEPSVPDGTLVKVTLELDDGSTRLYEVVKGQIVDATAITPSSPNVEMKSGESKQITFTFTPENATYQDIQDMKLTSSDESIATVSSEGIITLKSDAPFGKPATVTAISKDGVSTQIIVVNNGYTPTTETDIETGDLNTLTLSPSDGKTFEGASLACTPANAVSLDSPTGVLTISPSVANGTLITCTITYNDDSTEEFSIVKGAIISLDSISINNLGIPVGDWETIVPTFSPSNATYKDGFWIITQDDEESSEFLTIDNDNKTVAIIDNESFIGQTANLTISSTKQADIDCSFTITAERSTLTGIFSVSSTKKVRFCRGNTYWDGKRFKSERYQYNYRTWGGKVSVIDTTSSSTGTPSGNVGLFYYSKDAKKTYALSYSDSTATTSDAFALASGKAISGFDMLSNTEWTYLLSTRTNASQKAGLATITPATGVSVNGCVILPDSFTKPSTCSWTSGYSNVYNTNQYNASQWADMEEAGAVFFPASGARHNSVIDTPTPPIGTYWATFQTSSSASKASNFYFYSGGINVGNGNNRSDGLAVRFVKTV